MSSSVQGTNVPPVSFPGIASGIDYNSIINKLTSLTLSPNTQLNAQIATLNAANAELIKINGLVGAVQNALATLSDPSLFETYAAQSSNVNVATAQGLPSVSATPGTYVVTQTQVATASSVTSSASAGHRETDTLTSGPYTGQASDTVPLAQSYAAVTPSNGGNSAGQITIDGQVITYNVNTDSIDTIMNRIYTAVSTNYDASFTINFQPGTDVVSISGSKPITIGSASDQGNLEQVLKLDQAQVNNSGPVTSVTGTSGVGGINDTASLNTGNDANTQAPITSGYFTINGVKINVDASGDNINSVLQKINASTAGVSATYNASTGQIQLVSKATGPQSIVVGSGSDTSNFLTATGLTSASGAATSVGSQASVTLQTSTGLQTYYSNSNNVTNAIPGIQINLVSTDTTSPFTIQVNQNTTNLVSAVNTFISAYNGAISEINNATMPPVVIPSTPGASLPGNPNSSVGGGVLFNNGDVSSIKDELTNMVSGFFGNQGSNYSSLASIGLNVSDSFSVLTTANNGSQNGGTSAQGSSSTDVVQQTTYQGTDGTLQALDMTKFMNALQADPAGVQALFQGSNSLTNSLGSYLTSVTGAPTLLASGPVGTIPTTSTLQGFENSNTDQITSIQTQIKQIIDNANAQADALRNQFVSVEGTIAELQAEQQQLGSMFSGSSGG